MKKIILIFLLMFILFTLSSNSLELTFVGDIMAHDVNFRYRDFTPVYENVKDLFLNDDLSFGNLEFPVSETMEYSTYPRFNVQRDYVRSVINAGLDVFSLANNHSFDKGMEGLYQTIISMILLKEEARRPIYFSGTRGNPEHQFRPVTIEKKGIKIGFIALTGFSNIYPKEEYIHIVNPGNKKDSAAFIDFVTKESVKYDLFIVSYHEGLEYKYKPNKTKEEYFKKIINAGAHIVYGHHPHVLQPVEIITVKGQRRLIIYSAGNFISGQRWYYAPIDLEHYRSYTGDSAVYKVTVEKNETGMDITALNVELITNHIDERRQVVVKKYKDIINEPVPGNWQKYYRERYKIMQKFLPKEAILKNKDNQPEK